jgi:type IV pilus assembly protein PilA
MTGTMPRLTLLLALAALVAGCGSSSTNDGAPKANTQQQAQDDALAKSNARVAVTEIESCFVDQDAYTGCEPSKPGITATTTDTTYKVTADSKSGNSFVVSKDASGALKRTCTTAGNGGCTAAGAW